MSDTNHQIELQDVRALLDHFNGAKAVDAKTLQEYCTRKGIPVIVPTQYEDFLFQDQHDKRVAAALPGIFAALSKYEYVHEYISKEEKKRIIAANDDIEIDVAKVLEDHGIVYKEVDIITKNVGSMLQNVMENAGSRMNALAARVFQSLAKEKFGDELRIKDIALWERAGIAEEEAVVASTEDEAADPAPEAASS